MNSELDHCAQDQGLSSYQALVSSLAREGVSTYIANCQGDFRVIDWGGSDLSFAFHQFRPNSSYVCSPFSQNISYAQSELEHLSTGWSKAFQKKGLSIFGQFLRAADIDNLLLVNPQYFSTHLYPDWMLQDLDRIAQHFIEAHADRVILFRCLNEDEHCEQLQTLKELGFLLIPSRVVYQFDRNKTDYLKKYVVKRDAKLVAKASYQVVGHSEMSAYSPKEILNLYRSLYLNKHSFLNPQFTEPFVEACLKKRILEFEGLVDEKGGLQGVVGYFAVGKTLSTPFLGYETDQKNDPGLYRMLVSLVLQKAARENKHLNFSSGAGEFKRRRGGGASVEYSCVYVPPRARMTGFAWQCLGGGMQRLVIPYMKKNHL